MHLITSIRNSFSASEIQRQLEHNRYEPVWLMLHTLREVMGRRNEEYQLTEEIELDVGCFSAISSDEDKNKPLKLKKKQSIGKSRKHSS